MYIHLRQYLLSTQTSGIIFAHSSGSGTHLTVSPCHNNLQSISNFQLSTHLPTACPFPNSLGHSQQVKYFFPHTFSGLTHPPFASITGLCPNFATGMRACSHDVVKTPWPQTWVWLQGSTDASNHKLCTSCLNSMSLHIMDSLPLSPPLLRSRALQRLRSPVSLKSQPAIVASTSARVKWFILHHMQRSVSPLKS